MSDPDPIQRMSERVAQCRRLAKATTDERTAQILRQMADEGEADMKKLLSEREQRVSDGS